MSSLLRLLKALRSRRRRKNVAGIPPQRTDRDKADVRHLMVELALVQLDGQLGASDSYDVKATGLLAVDGLLIAVSVAQAQALGRVWWIPILGGAVASVAAIWTMWPRDFNWGPPIADFNSRFGGLAPTEANAQMLAELMASHEGNLKTLGRKLFGFRCSVLMLELTLFASALSFYLCH